MLISLKREAEEIASRQGISLNQFIMWSVSEKVVSLHNELDAPNYPGITYRRGASGWVTPVIRGTGIRVQTIIVDLQMGMNPEQIAAEYDLDVNRIREAQAFYNAHRPEIDANIRAEKELEETRGKTSFAYRCRHFPNRIMACKTLPSPWWNYLIHPEKTMPVLFRVLDRFLSEADGNEWIGQARRLNDWIE